jgi:hypothetical protein
MCDETGHIHAARKRTSLSAMVGDIIPDEQADVIAGATFDGQDL